MKQKPILILGCLILFIACKYKSEVEYLIVCGENKIIVINILSKLNKENELDQLL